MDVGYEHERFWERLDRNANSSILAYSGITTTIRSTIASIYYPTADASLDSRADEYLVGRGLDPDLARGFGWYAAKYNGPRLIVPCVRTDPYAFWQGRLIDGAYNVEDTNYKRWDSPSGPRGDALVYLVPTHLIVDAPLLIVEGPLDALAIAEHGYDVVAVLGATPPGVVLNHLASIALATRPLPKVLWIPDKDAVKPAMKRQQALSNMGVLAIVQMLPGAYKDFAEIPREERKEVLEWLLQK